LANGPARKRAVSASKTVTQIAEKRPVARVRRAAASRLEADTPAKNYALHLTESAEDVVEDNFARRRREDSAGDDTFARRMSEDSAGDDTFARRMSEALRAIKAAQETPEKDAVEPRSGGRAPVANAVGKWLKALDKMPPIRLPVGPAVPWRVGLPALIAVVGVMVFLGRPSARADAQPVHLLPAQETYAVQQEAPLFANSANAQTDPSAAQPVAAPTPQPIGVSDPATGSFDFVDIVFKLIAVLALAYGSMMLLKRAGIGGGTAARAGGSLQGMRVISTLALAPNRSVHVLKVPGGKTLLVGATPNAVNLIADLGELAEDEAPEAATFLDVLKGKLGS
jgi:flagellar biogenesis protein FliO